MTKGYHITSRSYFLCCLYAFKLSSKFKMNANVACSLCIAHHFHSHTQTIYSLFFFFFFLQWKTALWSQIKPVLSVCTPLLKFLQIFLI